ncbi:MAG: type II secretion system F family protein [Candidatus Aenigmarchaeota archaeon]|nr:type II secretion system F family protein [Candidatus Aenigmarchaeota archaeon]MDW8149098.1 type II secretion system F family protein [Candidatus Aenigmarchaeota archaeon]
MSLFYEKTCNVLGRFLNIKFDESTENKLNETLKFCNIETNARYVFNTVIFLILTLVPFSLVLILFKFFILGLFFLVIGLSLSLYFIYYPSVLSKHIRATSSPDLILTILYMVISLRIVPNLENALKFASENVKGYIGKQLKKLFYELNVGLYKNADEALEKFAEGWKVENEEFYDAIETIRASIHKSEKERAEIFEKLINTLLERNMDRLKIYAQELKVPITIITYMGIVLPILVTIMIPVLTSFIGLLINPFYISFLYNFLIPSVILIFNNMYLKSFPTFLSEIEFGKISNTNKIGYLSIKNKNIPILPISILIAVLFSFLGWSIISNEERSFFRLIGAKIIVLGFIFSIIFYSYFSYFKNSKIRDRIVKLEEEFPTALYNLGNLLTLGYSTENIISKLNEKIKSLEIHRLFEKALHNIKAFGFTLQRAIFDEEIGAIKEFRSSLIENVMKIIIEAMKIGGFAVSQAVITISNYLRTTKRVEMFSKEIFDDITSEINILLLLLLPLFSGMIVGITGIITDVMNTISNFVTNIVGAQNATIPFAATTFLPVNFKKVMPIEYSALIFGIYMIEISIISILFLSTLEGGKDKIKKYEKMTKIFLIQAILFSISSLAIYSLTIFLPLQALFK